MTTSPKGQKGNEYDTENDNMLKKFLRDKYIKKMYLMSMFLKIVIRKK